MFLSHANNSSKRQKSIAKHTVVWFVDEKAAINFFTKKQPIRFRYSGCNKDKNEKKQTSKDTIKSSFRVMLQILMNGSLFSLFSFFFFFSTFALLLLFLSFFCFSSCALPHLMKVVALFFQSFMSSVLFFTMLFLLLNQPYASVVFCRNIWCMLLDR